MGFLLWIFFSLIMLWSLFFSVTEDQYTLVRWISYLSPWVVGLLILCCSIAILLKKKTLLISALIMCVLLGYPYVKQFVPNTVNPPDGSRVYKVMSYSKMGRNHDIGSMTRVVMSEVPDILFMQEISQKDAGLLIEKLKDLYDGQSLHYFSHDHYGLVLSRYPLSVDLKQKNLSLLAKVTLNGIQVQIWNVHLQKSIYNTKIQYKMLAQLTEQIKSVQEPKIVAGDFNATRVNHPYKSIAEYLSNAFEATGFGFGFTFPSNVRRMGTLTPFMRIDHIFHSNHFKAIKAYVVSDAGGSDHYPIVALLAL